MYSYCDKKLLLDSNLARPAICLQGYLLVSYIDESVSILKIVRVLAHDILLRKVVSFKKKKLLENSIVIVHQESSGAGERNGRRKF